MKKYLFVLIFLIIGCGQADEGTRWVELPIKIKIHNDNQKNIIEFYNNQFSEDLFEISEEDDAVDVIGDDMSDPEKQGLSGWTIKDYDEKGFIVWGQIGLSTAKWYNFYDSETGQIVFAHELMHLLGYAGHDDDPESLMYKSVNILGDLDGLFQPHLKEWIKKTYEVN